MSADIFPEVVFNLKAMEEKFDIKANRQNTFIIKFYFVNLQAESIKSSLKIIYFEWQMKVFSFFLGPEENLKVSESFILMSKNGNTIDSRF